MGRAHAAAASAAGQPPSAGFWNSAAGAVDFGPRAAGHSPGARADEQQTPFDGMGKSAKRTRDGHNVKSHRSGRMAGPRKGGDEGEMGAGDGKRRRTAGESAAAIAGRAEVDEAEAGQAAANVDAAARRDAEAAANSAAGNPAPAPLLARDGTARPPRTYEEREKQRRVIVVLQRATLETVKKGGDYQLLNCDDHAHILRKHKRDPNSARPDIAHQCLLALLDSPLNKRGLLQVFLETEKGVLVEVNPRIRIPRTFRRFAGLMVQLLHKLSIRASDGAEKLLKVVKNPVSRHLPVQCYKIGTSCQGKLVNLREYVPTLPSDKPLVFYFGAMSHGFIDTSEADETVSFSEYPLSGACAIGKLMNAIEDHWGIL